eukprot:IDg16322t1
MKAATTAVLAIMIFALAARSAAGCACAMPDSVLQGYGTETGPLMKARALRELEVHDPLYKWYIFEYNFVFRGCVPSAYEIAVKTPRTKETCGLEIELGTRYLLSLQLSGGATPPPAVAAHAPRLRHLEPATPIRDSYALATASVASRLRAVLPAAMLQALLISALLRDLMMECNAPGRQRNMAQTDTSVLEWPSLVDEEVVHVEGDPQLRVVFWTRAGEAVPSGEARAVAIYHPGMGEHSGRYRHIASELLSRCPSLHAFATHDMRGHGGSSGARGAIESTTELEDDFVKRVLPAVATRFGTELRVLLMGQYVAIPFMRARHCEQALMRELHEQLVGWAGDGARSKQHRCRAGERARRDCWRISERTSGRARRTGRGEPRSGAVAARHRRVPVHASRDKGKCHTWRGAYARSQGHRYV